MNNYSQKNVLSEQTKRNNNNEDSTNSMICDFLSQLGKINSIRLSDKALFDGFLANYPLPISELNFTNLFLWKHYYNLRWMVYDDHLILFSLKNLEDCGYLEIFPVLGPDPGKVYKTLFFKVIETFRDIRPRFIRIPEDHLRVLEAQFSVNESGILPNIIEDRDNWDYLYRGEDLIKLPGKSYLTIRQKINKFKRYYDWSFEWIKPGIIGEVKEFHHEWCEKYNCMKQLGLIYEKENIGEILDNWELFDLIGGVLRVDNKIAAYTFYERIGEKMLVCHVEKGDYEYKGIYNALQNITLKNIQEKGIQFEYVNREQDLGIEGLRTSKMRYHPCGFIKKWIVIPVFKN